MGTAIATLGGRDVAEFKKQLANFSAKLPTTMGGLPWLRFEKGDWTIGDDEVYAEDRLIVNPLTITHGWVCWKDDDKNPEKLAEILVPFNQPVPAKDELDEYDDGDWSEQIGFQLTGLDGDFEGELVQFSTNSKGGVEAVQNLIKAILLQLDKNPVFAAPIIALDSTNYKHKVKRYGTIYKPVFVVDDWGSLESKQRLSELSEDEVAAMLSGETVDDEAPKSAKRTDAEDEAPKRTRRSRSRDDEDEAGEDEAPKRSRRSRSRDDEDEAGEDEAPKRSRRSRSRDDEDEAGDDEPKRRTRSRQRDDEDAGESKRGEGVVRRRRR